MDHGEKQLQLPAGDGFEGGEKTGGLSLLTPLHSSYTLISEPLRENVDDPVLPGQGGRRMTGTV